MQANEKGRPGGTGAAKQTNEKQFTTARPFRASNRRPLAPAQRGPFWASVGELIEQARRAAR